MRLIFLILMICGIAAIAQSVFERAEVDALWSDFKAFEAKVTAEENGELILALGRESDPGSFEDLLAKLWASRLQTWQMVLGIAVVACSILGLGLEVQRTQKSSERIGTG